MKSFSQYLVDSNPEAVLTEEWVQSSIEVATDFFVEEGINEEGIDLIVEEIGLEEFTDFVVNPPTEYLEEAVRAAKKAAANAPSYEKVKAKVDAGDAARKTAGKGEYAKTTAAKNKYGDEDNTNYEDDAPKKAAVKKAPAKKKAATQKKVVATVKTVKAKQPKKPAKKEGVLSKVTSYVKKGVEKHNKAVGDAKAAYKKTRAKGKVPEKRVKEFTKGAKEGVKDTVSFAKKAYKAVSGK